MIKKHKQGCLLIGYKRMKDGMLFVKVKELGMKLALIAQLLEKALEGLLIVNPRHINQIAVNKILGL